MTTLPAPLLPLQTPYHPRKRLQRRYPRAPRATRLPRRPSRPTHLYYVHALHATPACYVGIPPSPPRMPKRSRAIRATGAVPAAPHRARLSLRLLPHHEQVPSKPLLAMHHQLDAQHQRPAPCRLRCLPMRGANLPGSPTPTPRRARLDASPARRTPPPACPALAPTAPHHTRHRHSFPHALTIFSDVPPAMHTRTCPCPNPTASSRAPSDYRLRRLRTLAHPLRPRYRTLRDGGDGSGQCAYDTQLATSRPDSPRRGPTPPVARNPPLQIPSSRAMTRVLDALLYLLAVPTLPSTEYVLLH
ncbi:hypothetical protein K438DRAFT_1976441 [Mycena galopus ATCC 62051]|nr:hypothetical protein K438DRAFT_1976441 [Mycena galopus ATCC 62051]